MARAGGVAAATAAGLARLGAGGGDSAARPVRGGDAIGCPVAVALGGDADRARADAAVASHAAVPDARDRVRRRLGVRRRDRRRPAARHDGVLPDPRVRGVPLGHRSRMGRRRGDPRGVVDGVVRARVDDGRRRHRRTGSARRHRHPRGGVPLARRRTRPRARSRQARRTRAARARPARHGGAPRLGDRDPGAGGHGGRGDEPRCGRSSPAHDRARGVAHPRRDALDRAGAAQRR